MTRRWHDIGPLVIAALLALAGIRGLRHLGEADLQRVLRGVMAFIALSIAIGIFRQSRWAAPLFLAWAAVLMAVDAWAEIFVAGESPIVVAVWFLLIGSVFGAVALYLRDALRRSRALNVPAIAPGA